MVMNLRAQLKAGNCCVTNFSTLVTPWSNGSVKFVVHSNLILRIADKHFQTLKSSSKKYVSFVCVSRTLLHVAVLCILQYLRCC